MSLTVSCRHFSAKTIVECPHELVHAAAVEKYSYYFGMPDRFTDTYSIALKIGLNTGESLCLYEAYYKNFDELKEGISRARFGLD